MGVLFVLLTNTSHMLLGWGCFSQADTGGARALAVIRNVAHGPHTHTHTLSLSHTYTQSLGRIFANQHMTS